MTSICEHQWMVEPLRSGRASHGDRRAGQCRRRKSLRCLGCRELREVDCGSSRRTRCEWCSEKYRRRVRRVAASGMGDVVLLPGRAYFLTLTAAGEGKCPSWCPCLANAAPVSVLNGRYGKGFNRFMQELRREVERRGGGDVQYFRATEVQERGALHAHVPFRVERPVKLSKALIRRLAIAKGFGHSVDLQELSPRHASYCAKYVSKAADQRDGVRVCDRATGELSRWKGRSWSASRRWGESMSAVRAAQRAWVENRRLIDASGVSEEATAPAGALDPNRAHYTSVVPVCLPGVFESSM